MKKLAVTLSALLLLMSFPVQAQVFSVSLKSGNKLFFNVIDSTAHKVEITQPGKMIGVSLASPAGSLDLPASVPYKGVSYEVAAIHEQAFANAAELTFVSIPSSVKEIGAQAFAACTALEGIVFPAAQPKIAKDAFEGCTALRNISFGSDWTAVDLGLFSQSASLESIFIPAKVGELTHVKLIKTLAWIDVDKNNRAFSSIDGVLYSGNGKVLYTCPTARGGAVSVPEGVERILGGAFWNCEGLTAITLSSTVHEFSYQEFALCPALQELNILSEMPPMTAKWNGSPVFCIYKPAGFFKVYVPSANQARYQAAVCDKAGEYVTLDGKQKANYPQDGFLTAKEILKSKTVR